MSNKKIEICPKCGLGLHESLAGFNMGQLKSINAQVAFFQSNEGKLLLVKDEKDNWSFPAGVVKTGYLLVQAPDLVHKNVFGGEQLCQFDRRVVPKLVGQYEEESRLNIIVAADIHRPVPSEKWKLFTWKELTGVASEDSKLLQIARCAFEIKIPSLFKPSGMAIA